MLRRNRPFLHQPFGSYLGNKPDAITLALRYPAIGRKTVKQPRMSTMNTQDGNPHIRAISLHLETIARTLVVAIDQRLLSAQSPSLVDPRLDFIDPFFKASPMPPWDHAPLDFEGFVTYIRTVVEANPEYSIRLSDVSSHVNDRAGTAEVFLNVEVEGMPPGVVRKSVGVMKFRRSEDRWRCFTYQGADGNECT